MMAHRREIKYLVDRTTRTPLTRDLVAFMHPDRYSQSNGSYTVRSIYFDTPGYMAYHDKMAGLPSRYKLRIRAYGDPPTESSGARFEVKVRSLHNIDKFTMDVPWEEYEPIERAIRRRALPSAARRIDRPVSSEFFRILHQYNMEPKVLIQYRRQAWERREMNRLRVNFDDELVASRSLELQAPLSNARRLLQYGHAIFEIKVDGALPYWMHMLIAKYNLQDRSISKYCHAVRSEARLSTALRASHDLA